MQKQHCTIPFYIAGFFVVIFEVRGPWGKKCLWDLELEWLLICSKQNSCLLLQTQSLSL